MTTLKHGDKGQAVHRLQKSLIAQGAKLIADGDYGDQTEAAVLAYQHKIGLVPDGIAGEKTLYCLQSVTAPSIYLGARDLQAAAERLGVPLASILAVNEVESAGAGFLDNVKPKILFERHVMLQRLAAPRHPDDDPAELQQRAKTLALQWPALVNATPGGYAGGTAEWQRLSQARTLDAAAANESTSWGAFQIMGYHWERLGYASLDAFVASMHTSEAAQLDAFVRFIEADPALHKALKARKWAEFAKRYNGPNYARNLYDVKLERAYQRHAQALEVAA